MDGQVSAPAARSLLQEACRELLDLQHKADKVGQKHERIDLRVCWFRRMLLRRLSGIATERRLRAWR
jgi:hypothetical protein